MSVSAQQETFWAHVPSQTLRILPSVGWFFSVRDATAKPSWRMTSVLAASTRQQLVTPPDEHIGQVLCEQGADSLVVA